MNLGNWLREQLFERRIVLVTGRLDDDAAARTAAALLTLDACGNRPIELHLDSPGGALGATFILVDTADTLRSELRVLCRGQVGGSADSRGRGSGSLRRHSARAAPTSPSPRWTPENRPVVDGAKPASGKRAPSTSVLPRSIVIEQALRGDRREAVEGDSADMAPSEIGAFLAPKRAASCRRRGLRPRSARPGGGCASSGARRSGRGRGGAGDRARR